MLYIALVLADSKVKSSFELVTCGLPSKNNSLEVFCLILNHVSPINITSVCISQVTAFLVAELSA